MTLAAEFPNDNPDLHEGTIWVCLDVTGLPVAERRPVPVVVQEAIAAEVLEAEVVAEEESPPPSPRESGIFMVLDSFSSLRDEEAADDDEEIVVEELAPLEDVVEEVLVVAPEPIVAEPIVAESVALEAVIEPEPIVLEEPAPVVTLAPPPPDDPWVTFVSTLVDIAIAHGATAAAAELPAMLEGQSIARAWAGILRGTSEDWDAIGGSMLDEWASETLACVIGAEAQMLKRELRARGIAAFGLAA